MYTVWWWGNNTGARFKQINRPYVWDCFYEMDRDVHKCSDNRTSEDWFMMVKGRIWQTFIKGTGTKHAGEITGSSRSRRLHLLNNMGTELPIFGECSLGIWRGKILESVWGPSYVDESEWDFTVEEIKGRAMGMKNSKVTEINGLSGRLLCQERVCWNFGDFIILESEKVNKKRFGICQLLLQCVKIKAHRDSR